MITAVRMMHELGVVCHFPEVDPEIVILVLCADSYVN